MTMCCCSLAIFDSCFETRGRRWKDWLGWLWLLCSGWQSKGTHLLGKVGKSSNKEGLAGRRTWDRAGQGRAGHLLSYKNSTMQRRTAALVHTCQIAAKATCYIVVPRWERKKTHAHLARCVGRHTLATLGTYRSVFIPNPPPARCFVDTCPGYLQYSRYLPEQQVGALVRIGTRIICHQRSVASHLASKDNTSHHIPSVWICT